MVPARRFGSVLLVGAVLGAGGTRPALAQAPDSLDDGPHVYWLDRDRAMVLYLCGGELDTIRVAASPTVRFRGRCADSGVEYRISRRPAPPEPAVWRGVSRVLAVSDIHGEYDALVAFLRAAGVVTPSLAWRWGDGHLVVLGDVFDRGDRVTECLWLLYRLQQEAEAAGGRVHLLLGNHEMMVLRDDLRYVHPRYPAGIVRRSRIRYPDLFGPDMELGRWIRRWPVAVTINAVLYVHGGMAPELVDRQLDLATVNRLAGRSLDLPSSALAFSDRPRFLFGPGGPLWYRGYHAGDDERYNLVTSGDVDTVLRFYGVTAIVVGHSEIPRVAALLGGRVYGIDVPVETLGGFEGLLVANGTFARVTPTGAIEPLPNPTPRTGLP